MRKMMAVLIVASLVLGLTACGDTQVNKTTEVKKEVKVDSDGNEKTRVETTTVETTERRKDGTVIVKEEKPPIVREEKDPIVKLGPIEIRKKD